MTNAEAAKRMAEILDNPNLSEWDCWCKIQMLIEEFEK